jgi:hypothetical protein
VAVVRVLVSALFATVGLGLVPALLYSVAGVLVGPFHADIGRHLRVLGGRVWRPMGTRVVDWAGRSVYRQLPGLAGGAAIAAVEDAIDYDEWGDLGDEDWGDNKGDAQPLTGGTLLAIVWLLLVGLELAVFHIVVGLLLCLTLVGVPFGVRHFALAVVALFPTRSHILKRDERLPENSEWLAHGAQRRGPAATARPSRRAS